MSVRVLHTTGPSLYFITFTCHQWLPLFERANAYDLVYKWFTYLQQNKEIKTTAFVIMPNHVHMVLYFPKQDGFLNTIIANGKRFMAYGIIKKLSEKGEVEILQQLERGVTEREKKKGQLHKVFEESFDAKTIDTKVFLLQKINYIHQNPVRGKWQLADNYTAYPHSSASFYANNKSFYFTPIHYDELY